MSDRISAVLVVVGAFFMLLAGVGVLRLPDVFMRLQAATKAATLGVGFMLLAVAIHFQDLAVATRAVLVTAFVFLTAPVGAHMIARAAYAVGAPLWEGTITDELRQDSARKTRTLAETPTASRAHADEKSTTAEAE